MFLSKRARTHEAFSLLKGIVALQLLSMGYVAAAAGVAVVAVIEMAAGIYYAWIDDKQNE